MSLHDAIVYAGGKFCRYDEARVGLLTHALNYGTGCFEGIRGYWEPTERELFLLHLRDHYERLTVSAKILFMALPHAVDELSELTIELCARNRFEGNVYIRPLLYKNAEDIGVRLHNVSDGFAIMAVPFGKYIEKEGSGIDVAVSSWRRSDDCAAPARAKITGVYVNSAFAKTEALQNGFDEAIVLSADGHVSEGSAENLFMVRNRVLYTPDPSQNILEGITRRSVLTLARDVLGLAIVERAVDRSELYSADELFFSGTAVGIQPIGSVDRRPVGDGAVGEVTRTLMLAYERAVHGREPKYRHWLTPVYAKRAVA
jgi:branched-chain amino acid aminotransferase